LDLESYFISLFSKKYIGDDAAVVDGYIYSKDAFFEGVHFKREWLTPYEIATKAMLVNISDAVAMAAKPKYALLSVALPKDITKHEAKELARGFNDVASLWGIEIIGGDTISNTKIDITITLISKAKKPLYRKGLKSGDLLAFTGNVGQSAKELQKLFQGRKITKKSKFKTLKLPAEFIYKTRRFLRVGMDVSDGIYADIARMAKLNKTGFHFLQKLPKVIGCSGEEYEMIIGFDKRYKKAIIRYAKQTRTPLTIFAKAQRKSYKNRCKGHHFG